MVGCEVRRQTERAVAVMPGVSATSRKLGAVVPGGIRLAET
jgi:hypothetical protein